MPTLSPRLTAQTAVIATFGTGLLLAGCTGGTGGTDGNGNASTPPSQTAATPPASVENATDELDDVTCKHGKDGWSFEGKIKNSGKQAMIYTVTVRIAPKKDKKQTIGLTTVTKQVEPKKTVDFIAKNFSKLEADGNTCIPIATKS